jgi:hypothetical protein
MARQRTTLPLCVFSEEFAGPFSKKKKALVVRLEANSSRQPRLGLNSNA